MDSVVRLCRCTALVILVHVFSAVSSGAAVIDFTSGTFDCSFASLDPITNYQDQGVTIRTSFYVMFGGANVQCPAGYPVTYRPSLPWPFGITSYVGTFHIAATSEISRIETDGWADVDGDGWIDLYAMSGTGTPILCTFASGCLTYPDDAVRLPPGERTFDLLGLGWTSVYIVGGYARPIGINEIETVPEPGALVVLGMAIVGAVRRRRWWHSRRS